MRLTVLGRHGLYPPRGGACSSFYLQMDNGRALLMDCGPGALAKMDADMIGSLDALVLSHLHWDHISDALPLRYALERLGKNIDFYLPGEPGDVAAWLAASDRINPRWISDGMEADAQGFSLSFVAMRHPMPSYGVRVRAEGALLVYSGDTNTCEALTRLMEGEPEAALVDACLSDEQWDQGKPHLSARLAAAAMEKAGVKLPLLTHLPPDGDQALLLDQARQACPQVAWATEGATIAIRG